MSALNSFLEAVEPRLLPMTAEVDGRGRLVIGGVDILDLVGDVGTPVFVYDEEHLRSRCRAALAAFDGRAAYASKAFLCRAMAARQPPGRRCTEAATRHFFHVMSKPDAHAP